MDAQVLAFAALALAVTVSPGPDTFLAIGNTLARGVRGGLLTVGGIVSGGAFHAALMGFGLSAVLLHSEAAFLAVRVAGAAYLCWLGARTLHAAWARPRTLPANGPDAPPPARDLRACYVQGLLTNALNPKVAAFYLAALPQFMSPGDPFALKAVLMVGIHYAISALWLPLLVLGVGRARRWLGRAGVRRWLDSVVGGAMMAFGLRLALAPR